MKIGTLHVHRYFPTLLVILLWCAPLGAQETGEEGWFYLDLTGSAVFSYDPRIPSDAGVAGPGYEVGTGFTAAFGYGFKEGFSTEMEWGYRKVGVGNSAENLLQDIDLEGFTDFPGLVGGLADFSGFQLPSIGIEIDGELETQSLMGNAYYRYPEWRVRSLCRIRLVGTFFHDGAFTSTFTVGNELGNIDIPRHRDSRRSPHEHRNVRGFPVFLSDHGRPLGSGLPARGVPLWLSLPAPVEGQSSIPTRLRAASGSGSDANLWNGAHRYFCSRGFRGPPRTITGLSRRTPRAAKVLSAASN